MVREVVLNDVKIQVTSYHEEEMDGVQQISFDFKVRSGEEYHKITTLLYEQTFDIKVPERKLAFRGTIVNYSTSITNLYKEHEVGDFSLVLKEIIKGR